MRAAGFTRLFAEEHMLYAKLLYHYRFVLKIPGFIKLYTKGSSAAYSIAQQG